MPENHDQLGRIERKLDALTESLALVKENQARDLERFQSIEQDFEHLLQTRQVAIDLHAAQCPLHGDVSNLQGQINVVLSKAKGASWAAGAFYKVLAAIVGFAVAGGELYKAFHKP